MNTENGKIEGNINITEDFQLNGVVTASASVINGAYFKLNGVVSKDLTIAAGSSVDVNGVVNGNIINEGGVVNVTGVVRGSLYGAAHVSANAVVG